MHLSHYNREYGGLRLRDERGCTWLNGRAPFFLLCQVTEHRTGSVAERARLASIDLDTAHVTVPHPTLDGAAPPPSFITVVASSPGRKPGCRLRNKWGRGNCREMRCDEGPCCPPSLPPSLHGCVCFGLARLPTTPLHCKSTKN